MNLIKCYDPNSLPFFLIFPPGFDTLPAEFPSLPEQQDKLQLGVWDAAVSGLYLWKHNWWTWTSWSVYKWEKCCADQPDAGKFDRVLPGALPREPGNTSELWKASPFLPTPTACALLGLDLSLTDFCHLITLLTLLALQRGFGLFSFISL